MICVHRNCEREANYKCTECGKQFCLIHTLYKHGYRYCVWCGGKVKKTDLPGE